MKIKENIICVYCNKSFQIERNDNIGYVTSGWCGKCDNEMYLLSWQLEDYVYVRELKRDLKSVIQYINIIKKDNNKWNISKDEKFLTVSIIKKGIHETMCAKKFYDIYIK